MENKIKELIGNLLSSYRDVQRQIGLLDELESNTEKVKVMTDVKSALGRIKTIESELFPLRDEFVSDGKQFSEETRKLFETSTKLLQEIIPNINELEKKAQLEREQLLPAIHDGVRGMKMQSAYSQNQ